MAGLAWKGGRRSDAITAKRGNHETGDHAIYRRGGQAGVDAQSIFYGVSRVKRRLAGQFPGNPQAISPQPQSIQRPLAKVLLGRCPTTPEIEKNSSGNLRDPSVMGAGVAVNRGNERRELQANKALDRKTGTKTPFLTPERGGVLTPHSPILTFSSSIPQRRPRPEMDAGGCRSLSLQKCSSGGMASFPPASRGTVSPGRGRVGALRASWRAGWWGFGRFVWFFFRLAWLGSVGQG